MGRLNDDGDSSKGKTQLSVRVDDDLKQAFKSAADANGETMTDAADRLLREYVDDAGESVGDSAYPADRTLNEGYRALRKRADPDTRTLGTDAAESVVAQATSVSKSGVRREVLDPLERRGYLRYEWATIRVIEPEQARSSARAGENPATDRGEVADD